MISYSSLPISLWREVIKPAAHVLNEVLNKAVQKTPYELWTGRKPYLSYMHIWICLAEPNVYNPHEKAFDSRTISGFFISYLEKPKGYRFYYPSHSLKFVETGKAKFLEDGSVSGSIQHQDIVFEELQDLVLIPENDIQLEV